VVPTIVVPFREPSPKSRLPERARLALAQAMLEDVLTACREVGETMLATAPGGLGPAVAAALETVPAGTVLVVNADVPAATPRDLWALLGAIPTGGLALVEAADGTTNALALSTPTLFEPVYGPGSASRFRALGECRTIDLPNLAEDVDTLEDLERLGDRAGAHTRAALDELRSLA
jgi:2-phospho-L-lactate guanylyltransferase (CobY/MobA/RfbA family)